VSDPGSLSDAGKNALEQGARRIRPRSDPQAPNEMGGRNFKERAFPAGHKAVEVSCQGSAAHTAERGSVNARVAAVVGENKGRKGGRLRVERTSSFMTMWLMCELPLRTGQEGRLRGGVCVREPTDSYHLHPLPNLAQLGGGKNSKGKKRKKKMGLLDQTSPQPSPEVGELAFFAER